MSSGSLQVLATVLRSRIPCPFVSSFFILFKEFRSIIISTKFGVLPFAHDSEALVRLLIEEPARFSILLTALVARGVIHSAEQISAGSGVDAQALNNIRMGVRMRACWSVFMTYV